MEIYRDPITLHADRINHVLDHVFGASPHLSAKERSRNILQLLADELNKMAQYRKINHAQLTASDTGSSSGDDRPGMIKQEDTEQWTQWQPDMMYGPGYRPEIPAVSDDVWWPIPAQPGNLCDSAAPPYAGYAAPHYGYGMGSGPV